MYDGHLSVVYMRNDLLLCFFNTWKQVYYNKLRPVSLLFRSIPSTPYMRNQCLLITWLFWEICYIYSICLWWLWKLNRKDQKPCAPFWQSKLTCAWNIPCLFPGGFQIFCTHFQVCHQDISRSEECLWKTLDWNIYRHRIFCATKKCDPATLSLIRQINPRPAPSGPALCGIWHGTPAICSCIVLDTDGMTAETVRRVRVNSLAGHPNRQT